MYIFLLYYILPYSIGAGRLTANLSIFCPYRDDNLHIQFGWKQQPRCVSYGMALVCGGEERQYRGRNSKRSRGNGWPREDGGEVCESSVLKAGAISFTLCCG